MKRRILAAALSVAVLALPASQSGAAEFRMRPPMASFQFKMLSASANRSAGG